MSYRKYKSGLAWMFILSKPLTLVVNVRKYRKLQTYLIENPPTCRVSAYFPPGT